MLFLLILTLCYSVSTFDIEETINNLKDGSSVKGLLEGYKKINKNGEEIVENLEKFEKNLEHDLSFDRITDILEGRTKRSAGQNSIRLPYRFCIRVDFDYHYCPYDGCGEADCDNDLPDSFDWSQHITMPAKINTSEFSVAGVIADYVAIRYEIWYKQNVELAADQITDCMEWWEESFSWTGAVTRLMTQGGFELYSDYQADTTDARCRFDEDKIAVRLTSCYQLNIEGEHCLKQILIDFGPVLVGLRKANWDAEGDFITGCDAVLDTYTPFILFGYGTADGIDVWWLQGQGRKTYYIPRGVACQDMGMYTLFFDALL